MVTAIDQNLLGKEKERKKLMFYYKQTLQEKLFLDGETVFQ